MSISKNHQYLTIKSARPDDAATVAHLMMMEMSDIVHYMIGDISEDEAVAFLSSFIKQKNNQYSYQNCWLVESEAGIVGMANVYDGAKLEDLRYPILTKLKAAYNRDINIVDVTKAGEFYIDTIALRDDQHDTGLGTTLIKFLIEEYCLSRRKTLGLLVDEQNPKEKDQYLRLGFKRVGEMSFGGKEMQHLQWSIKKR